MSLNTVQLPSNNPPDGPPSPPPTKKRAPRRQTDRSQEQISLTAAGGLYPGDVDMYGRPGDDFERAWIAGRPTENPASDVRINLDSVEARGLTYLKNNSADFATILAASKDLDLPAIKKIVKWLNDGATAARNTDTATVRKGLSQHFGVQAPERLGCLPLSVNVRAKGYFCYDFDETGSLMTPIEMSWESPEDRQNLQTEGADTSDDFLFRYLFPGGVFDPDNERKGLMEGELVWKTYEKLFSSNKRSRSSRKRALPSITKARLAYAIALLHHALSGEETINDNFHIEGLYKNIYKFLSTPENENFWISLQVKFHSLIHRRPARPNKRRLVESQRHDEVLDLHISMPWNGPVHYSGAVSAPTPALTMPTSPVSSLSSVSSTNTDEYNAAQHNTVQPETDEPNAAHPNTDEPNTAYPNTDEPNAAHSNTDEPNAAHSNTDEPNTTHPNTSLSDNSQLDAAQSDTDRSGTSTDPTPPSKRQKANNSKVVKGGVKAGDKGGSKARGTVKKAPNTNNRPQRETRSTSGRRQNAPA